MEEKLTAGAEVWVVERDEEGIACEVSGYMFLAEVAAVQVDESYMKKNGKFELNSTGLLAYSHGEYRSLGKEIGRFGWSVKKR